MTNFDLASCRILASLSESCGGVIADGVVTLRATRVECSLGFFLASVSSSTSAAALNIVEKRPPL